MRRHTTHVAVRRDSLDVDSNFTIGKDKQRQVATMGDIEVQSVNRVLATERRFSAGKNAERHIAWRPRGKLTEERAKCRASDDKATAITLMVESPGARAFRRIENVVQRGDFVRWPNK
jgi:hypothetical protein